MSVQVTITGLRGTGKSTVARIISAAIRKAGLHVSLTDKSEMPADRFRECKKGLQQTLVNIEVKQ